MKLDNSIKALLLAVAMLLGILVVQPMLAPSAKAQAPAARPANLTFSGVNGGFWIFNHDTGEVFFYKTANVVSREGRLEVPGNPLVR